MYIILCFMYRRVLPSLAFIAGYYRKSTLTIEHKCAMFRQVLWHWRAALDVKNTLFTLVEAACVSLQHRLLYQVVIQSLLILGNAGILYIYEKSS